MVSLIIKLKSVNLANEMVNQLLCILQKWCKIGGTSLHAWLVNTDNKLSVKNMKLEFSLAVYFSCSEKNFESLFIHPVKALKAKWH